MFEKNTYLFSCPATTRPVESQLLQPSRSTLPPQPQPLVTPSTRRSTSGLQQIINFKYFLSSFSPPSHIFTSQPNDDTTLRHPTNAGPPLWHRRPQTRNQRGFALGKDNGGKEECGSPGCTVWEGMEYGQDAQLCAVLFDGVYYVSCSFLSSSFATEIRWDERDES